MSERQGRTTASAHSDKQLHFSSEYPRMLAIQRVGLAVSVIAGLAFIANLMIFFQTWTWHLLGITGLIALGGGIFFVARNVARKGRLNQASYLMIGALVVLLPSFAFFSTGLTSFLAVGTLVLAVTLAALVLPRHRLVWAVAAGLVGAGLTMAIDQMAPWPRFEMAQFALSRVATYGGVIIPILIILWQLVSAFRQTNTIRVRLLIAFVLVVLLPVAAISAGVVIGGLQSDRRQTLDRLETVATLKEGEIKNWVRDSQIELANVLNAEDMIQYAPGLQEDAGEALRRETHQNLRDHFRLSLSEGRRFEELFLMDGQGRVIVSTDPRRDATNHSRQVFFQEGLKGVYVQPPFYSPSLEEMSVIFTRPVISGQGHLFVLAGRSSVVSLNETVHKRAGLGETGQTYMVGGDYALVAASHSVGEGIKLYTQAVETAIEGHDNGVGSYDNYEGRSVLGVYHWLPELQVALVVEQGQSEAFRSTYTMLGAIGGIVLVALLAAVAVALLITRSISTPLADLAEAATQIAAGDLKRVAQVTRDDEVAALARAFNSMTGQLRELIGGLEQRVAERTKDLERRAVQLQAAAEVGQAATSIRDINELLPRVTHLISERFGFYHAGIFMLDETGEYAVLRAASSEGGRRMLARGHRLRVGEQGIVGYVTEIGEPRIALDVGDDAIHFKNPDLPLTRSEMALPLIVGGRVLGALDVQSAEEAAFAQEDISVLQVLADQVAAAIENARLFDETQEALEATRRAYGEISRQAWDELLRTRPDMGFRSDERGVTSAGDVWRPEMEEALREGRTVQISSLGSTDQPADGEQSLAVPIRVRGQVVGVLDTYKPKDAGQWTPDEIAILELITEQLGASLESARLYQDTQRRAVRERLTREITDELRRATSEEGVVQTAVDELFRVLGTSRAFGKLKAAPPSQDRAQTT